MLFCDLICFELSIYDLRTIRFVSKLCVNACDVNQQTHGSRSSPCNLKSGAWERFIRDIVRASKLANRKIILFKRKLEGQAMSVFVYLAQFSEFIDQL